MCCTLLFIARGNPDIVAAIANAYSQWLCAINVPKLFTNADTDIISTVAQRATEVPGCHRIQENYVAETGTCLQGKVLGGWLVSATSQ